MIAGDLQSISCAPRAALQSYLAGLLNPIPTALRSDAGRPAAVLVGVQWQTAEWQVIMTQRAGHLAHHAGQISFPGGKVDAEDRDLTATALREAEEEIALAATSVEIVGALDTVISPAGFVVQPIVGLVQSDVALVPAPDEVDSILTLPLSLVLDRGRHRQDRYEREGQHRSVWVIDHQDHYLWGLSATILVDLATRMTAASQ